MTPLCSFHLRVSHRRSGRYPFHFGFYKNQDANAYGLPANFSTIAELLGAKGGYACHMVGKVSS